MADEPTARSKWNIGMAINLTVLAVALWLLIRGVSLDKLTFEQALSYIGAAALGGGVTWAAK